MNSKLPIDIDRELQELGILPSTPFDDDLEEVRPKLTVNKFNMPVFDEDGEPDF